MHIGYCIACYNIDSHVFSAPIGTSKEAIRKILGREWPINGEELSREQFLKLRDDLLADFEIGWNDDLSYFVEGQNLPESDFSW